MGVNFILHCLLQSFIFDPVNLIWFSKIYSHIQFFEKFSFRATRKFRCKCESYFCCVSSGPSGIDTPENRNYSPEVTASIIASQSHFVAALKKATMWSELLRSFDVLFRLQLQSIRKEIAYYSVNYIGYSHKANAFWHFSWWSVGTLAYNIKFF